MAVFVSHKGCGVQLLPSYITFKIGYRSELLDLLIIFFFYLIKMLVGMF